MQLESETLREVGKALDYGEGYAEVSLIRQNSHCCLYSAVKAGKRFILKTAAGSSAKELEDLKREYELALSLSNPFIVYVFTYESSSPVGPCIVMEYVDGLTLRQYLAQKPSLELRRRVFSQLLDAVEYLHNKGVLHNDLSPENILITGSDNSVKLIDFGFADDDVHYVGKGQGCTRTYASPELLAGEMTDSRSDIYSLGVLMKDIFGCRYAMLSRRAVRKSPGQRFTSVSSLRNAWLRCRRLPVVMSLLLLAAVVSYISVDFVRMKREVVARQTALQLKDCQLDSLKARVNDWYVTEIPAYLSGIEASSSYSESIDLWTAFIDKYNVFWRKIMSDCPEDLSSDLTDYIVRKYNADFPLPPQCK